jgi:hypothetical protein
LARPGLTCVRRRPRCPTHLQRHFPPLRRLMRWTWTTFPLPRRSGSNALRVPFKAYFVRQAKKEKKKRDAEAIASATPAVDAAIEPADPADKTEKRKKKKKSRASEGGDASMLVD